MPAMSVRRKMTKGVRGALELVRLVRANLVHRKDMTRLRQIRSRRRSTFGDRPSTWRRHEPVAATRPAMTGVRVDG